MIEWAWRVAYGKRSLSGGAGCLFCRDMNSRFFITMFVLCAMAVPAGAQYPDAPGWARGMVWYLVMPDRFSNGDTLNDPHAEYIFDEARLPWKVSPWTTNWYQRTLEEKMLHDTFYPAALLRQYGGDIDGILSRLDYLQELGVEGLIFTPMFEARSSHKFDVSSFHHIDRCFGPLSPVDTAFLSREVPHDPLTWYLTAADRRFIDLVAEAHKRGMRVLMMAQLGSMSVWRG